MTDPRDLQIHIHEHVGPLRERVGRIEGAMQVHERELTMLRQGLDGLRDRIDTAKDAMLHALETHTKDEILRYDHIAATSESAVSKIDALRNWVVAIGIGAGVVFMVLEFLVRSGILQHLHKAG